MLKFSRRRRIEPEPATCYAPPMASSPSPRFAITLVFGVFGVIAGFWTGTVPTVAKSVGLDGYWLGIAFTGLMLATVLAMTAGGFLARYLSSRRVLLTTIPVSALAAVLVHCITVPWIFIAALLLYGFSLGLTDLFMNSEGSHIEVELGRPILSGLHGVASLCIGVCAILGSLIAVGTGPWAVTPFFVIAGGLATWVVARAIPERTPTPRATKSSSAVPVVYGALVLLGLAVGFENAGEITALFWSAKLLNEVAPALASIAGLGPAFFAGCNALVRLNGDRIRARYGDTRIVVVSLIVAAIGLIGIGVLPGFALRVAAFAVMGFGTACVIPCLYAIASNSDPKARTERLGFISMIAGPPRVLSPMLFGWIAERASMSTAFTLSSLMLVLALGLFLASLGGLAKPAASAAL